MEWKELVVIVRPGEQFGRLTVIAASAERLQGKRAMVVQCAFGSPMFLVRRTPHRRIYEKRN